MKLPESQGMWPAFWLLGNNIATISWPACGELDVMEHIDGNNPPPYASGTPMGYDWIAGSVHGGTSSNEANGSQTYHPDGFSAAAWHAYGMIWSILRTCMSPSPLRTSPGHGHSIRDHSSSF